MTDIGERLRLARIEAGMTLREVEDTAGVNKDGLSKIERGVREPLPLTVAKLAKVYGRPVEELLQGKALAPVA